ncbi:rRNA (guanine-N1)-methyltransferase [Rugosimonospora acidiphila]|uniref:rRNA (Guanine-N1)-methyltransferase n=1 Tax=Rugosimonospora acidiphila TaxID=556531 RepID=A0ABP9SBG1_9ACTN
MLAEVATYLRCPVCGSNGLAPAGAGADGDSVVTRLRCPRGHSFDRARQGYVDLTARPVPHEGDSAEMVAARTAFLGAGHYGFVSSALATLAGPADSAALTQPAEPAALGRPAESAAEALRGHGGEPAGGSGVPAGAGGVPIGEAELIVDAGAGTGAHLAAVLDARPGALGLALDVSRYALRRAARAHPRAAAARCDVWAGLPVADHTAALLLNVFAPRNGAEFARVLRPDGALLVVTPGPDHLRELVDALGLLRVDPSKEDRLSASLDRWFAPVASTVVRRRLNLDHHEIETLVGMGPSAWHAGSADRAARIAALPSPVDVTAEVRVARYAPLR